MTELVFHRVQEIMADREYRLALIQTLAEQHPEIIDAACMADSKDWMSALHNLHSALTSLAFEMAVSEFKVKNALAALVPNTVSSLSIRGIA